MSIGLPLIGAVPVVRASQYPHDEELVVESIHSIRINDALTLRIFTSDDITLETGGSVWHAGKFSPPIIFVSISPHNLENNALLLTFY